MNILKLHMLIKFEFYSFDFAMRQLLLNGQYLNNSLRVLKNPEVFEVY